VEKECAKVNYFRWVLNTNNQNCHLENR